MIKYLVILAVFVLFGCSKSNQSGIKEEIVHFNAGIGITTSSGVFGDVPSSKLVTYIIKNTGDAALLGPPTLDNSNFVITYQNGCALIAPAKSCTLKVSFDAKGKMPGTYETNLNLDSFFLELSANIPEIIINPEQDKASYHLSSGGESITEIDFGLIKNTQSIVKTFYLKNISQVSINQSVVFPSNYLVSYDACSNRTISKGSSCMVKMSLSGQGKSGNQDAILSYAGKSLNIKGEIQSTELAPNVTPVPMIKYIVSNAITTAVDFGEMGSQSSKIIGVSLKNTGNVSINAPVVLTGNYDLIYDSCSNKQIAVNSVCQLKVSLNGIGKSGTIAGNISFASQNLSLTGYVATAQSTSPTLFPEIVYLNGTQEVSNVDMGFFAYGTSKQLIINIKNKGNLSDSAKTAELNNSNFTIGYNQCINKSLAVNESCQVRIIFAANGKPEGTYNSILSYGNKSLNLAAYAGNAIITHHPNYSEYGICSTSEVCSGTGIKSRTLVSCQRLANGEPIEGGQLSDCSAFAIPSNLETSCLSPEGNKNIGLAERGNKTVFCSEGSQVESFVSLECSANHEPLVNNNQDCGLVSYEPVYSEFGLCSVTQMCQGQGSKERNLQSCNKLIAMVSAGSTDNLNCSAYDNSSYLTEPCLSPSGQKNVIIDNGNEDISCSEGSTEEVLLARNCNEDYYNTGSICSATFYIPTFSEYVPAIPSMVACDGTVISNRSMVSCIQQHDSMVVSNNKCIDNNPQVITLSPTGNKEISIANGMEIYSCEQGSVTQKFVSRNCDNNFYDAQLKCNAWSQDSGTLVQMGNMSHSIVSDVSSQVEQIQPLSNGTVLAFKRMVKYGRELYAITPPSKDSVILKDLTEGPADSYIYRIYPVPVANPTKGMFWEESPTEGAELYVSDGTPNGTVEVKQLGTSSNKLLIYESAQAWVTDGTYYYFSGVLQGTNAKVIVKTNGTTAGTTMTAIAGTTSTISKLGLYGTNKIIVFGVGAAGTAVGPYIFDGSTFTSFSNLTYTTGSFLTASNPKYYDLGSYVLFTTSLANNGIEFVSVNKSNNTLAVIDTFAGTTSGADLAAASHSSIQSTKAVILGSSLLYYGKASATIGYELYSTNGVTSTLVKDINPTANSSSSISSMTVFNGQVFFMANDGVNGTELWRSNGTLAGTVMVSNYAPGSASSNSTSSMMVWNNKLWLVLYNSTTGYEICNINTSNVFSCPDNNPGTGSTVSDLGGAGTTTEGLYFYSSNLGQGNEIYRIRTDNVIEQVTNLADGTGSSFISYVSYANGSDFKDRNLYFPNLGTTVYFAGSNSVGNNEVASYSTAQGVVFNNSEGFQNPNLIQYEKPIFGGVAYSANITTGYGYELGFTDINSSSLIDVVGGTQGASPMYYVEFLDKVLFLNNYSAKVSYTSNFSSVSDIPNAVYFDGGTTQILNDKLYFSGEFSNSGIGREIYSLDKNMNVSLIENFTSDELYPDQCEQYPTMFECDFDAPPNCMWMGGTCQDSGGGGVSDAGNTDILSSKVHQDKLFLGLQKQKTNGDTSYSFVKIDDQENVSYITGTSSVNYVMTSTVNDLFYFTSNFLFRYNNDVSTQISNVSSYDESIALENGKIVFICNSGGARVCSSNGLNSASTTALYSGDGTIASSGTNLYKVGINKILFFQKTTAHGKEIWVTDGTVGGTYVVDKTAGSSGYIPMTESTDYAVASNGYLYFLNYQESTGMELWRSDGTIGGTNIIESIPGPTSRFNTGHAIMKNSNGGVVILGYDDNKKMQFYRYRP